jgi:hypothetical protein
MGQTGSKLLLPSELSHETQALEIELYNVLPVPSDEVSLDDILWFKDRRNDELLALREAMDGLYLGAIDSSDGPRAKTAAIARLERSLRDLHKVVNESWAPKLLSRFKVELDVPSAVGGAAFGSAALNILPILDEAIGVAASAIKFELLTSRKANALPPELKDFAYLQSMEQELI